MKKNKLICYELNEVPFRVLDHYVKARPQSFLAQNLQQFSQITTHTQDSGELHPWSTWPTMHRGVTNDLHNIRYINQDLSSAKAYPPVWEILANKGYSIGLFGSLQSYPVFKHQNVLFYVPDTFSPAPDAYPERLKPFQKFNLMMAGKNKAIASQIQLSDLVESLKVFRSGIGVKSLLEASRQLLAEKRDEKNKSFRPSIQAHFAFESFFKVLKKTQPDFVSFFTNHVAGLMHRYWRYSFPEDFDSPLEIDEFSKHHQESILKGMDIADEQIKQLYDFAPKNGYDLVIASSMGQKAQDWGEYVPELYLKSCEKISEIFGLTGKVKLNPAMQPDVAFEFSDQSALEHFKTESQELKNEKGKPVLVMRYEPQGLTLNFTLGTHKVFTRSNKVLYRNKTLTLEDFGFSLIHRDPGTGYHCPEGMILWSGHKKPDREHRELMDSREYFLTLLNFFEVPAPDYGFQPEKLTRSTTPLSSRARQ